MEKGHTVDASHSNIMVPTYLSTHGQFRKVTCFPFALNVQLISVRGRNQYVTPSSPVSPTSNHDRELFRASFLVADFGILATSGFEGFLRFPDLWQSIATTYKVLFLMRVAKPWYFAVVDAR